METHRVAGDQEAKQRGAGAGARHGPRSRRGGSDRAPSFAEVLCSASPSLVTFPWTLRCPYSFSGQQDEAQVVHESWIAALGRELNLELVPLTPQGSFRLKQGWTVLAGHYPPRRLPGERFLRKPFAAHSWLGVCSEDLGLK